LLVELRQKLGIVLSVVHFNHKLRGKASERDEALSQNLQRSTFGVSFGFCLRGQKAKEERTNLEDTARRARYDYFRSLVESRACHKIAVATRRTIKRRRCSRIFCADGLEGLVGFIRSSVRSFVPC